MTHKLSSEMSSQKIDLSADIRFGSLTLLGGFVILDLKDALGGYTPLNIHEIWLRLCWESIYFTLEPR